MYMPAKSKAVKKAQDSFDLGAAYWWPKELSGNPEGRRRIKVDIKLKPQKPQPSKP